MQPQEVVCPFFKLELVTSINEPQSHSHNHFDFSPIEEIFFKTFNLLNFLPVKSSQNNSDVISLRKHPQDCVNPLRKLSPFISTIFPQSH